MNKRFQNDTALLQVLAVEWDSRGKRAHVLIRVDREHGVRAPVRVVLIPFIEETPITRRGFRGSKKRG